jgi:hypothetical protein
MLNLNRFYESRLTQSEDMIVTNLLDSLTASLSMLPQDKKRIPCQVVIQNKLDQSYDILESVALEFQLPWESMECNHFDPVVVNFALSHQQNPNYPLEKEGWKRYFFTKLQGSTRQRSDNVTIVYGDLVNEETNYAKEYDAIIEANCDSRRFQLWMHSDPRRYCVLHRTKCRRCHADKKSRVCHLNPKRSGCHFFPSHLPSAHPAVSIPTRMIRLCTMSHSQNHVSLSKALGILRPDDVQVVVHQRNFKGRREYAAHNISATFLQLADYLEFEQSIAQCDLLVLMTDPKSHPDYFPGKGREIKTPGTITHAIGYKIPMILHSLIEPVYREHFTAPVVPYTDDHSFILALNTILNMIRESRGPTFKEVTSGEELATPEN